VVDAVEGALPEHPAFLDWELTSVRTTGAGADSVHYLGPVPAEYVASAEVWSTMSQAPFTVRDDTVIVGFAGVNQPLVLGPDESVIDTVNPAAVRRRGVPPEQHGDLFLPPVTSR